MSLNVPEIQINYIGQAGHVFIRGEFDWRGLQELERTVGVLVTLLRPRPPKPRHEPWP